IAATSGNLTLTDLAITHVGNNPASVLIVAGGGYRFERLRVAGGVASKGAGGYGIVLRPSSGPLTPTGDARVLTDVVVSGNDGGGIVVAGNEAPTISRARVTGKDGCGLCWVEEAAGVVLDSQVTGTRVGLRIDNAAAPKITGIRVLHSEVGAALTGSGSPSIEESTFSGSAIGIQATGSGAPLFTGNQVLGSREIGIRLSGSSRTTLTDNRVAGATKVGIATLAKASSQIIAGEVTSTGDVGLIWGETATGSAEGAIVRGPKLGVQLASAVEVDLSDLVIDRSSAAALLADGTSKGTISRLTCGKGEGANVVLAGKTRVELVDSPSCTKRRP
ncbi:MAG: right-handed parallel beta-helix repeat-containing protein, partial [Micropruina sp.]